MRGVGKRFDVVRHLLVPFLAGALAGLVFAVLIVLTWDFSVEENSIEVTIATLEDPVEPLQEDSTEPEAPVERPIEEIVAMEVSPQEPAVPKMASLVAQLEERFVFLPQLAPVAAETVLRVPSPVRMQTQAAGRRGCAGRLGALRQYGGTAAGEEAVVRALRWLHERQEADGRWVAKGEGDATAFALLAFLAHGEDFASREFGETVKRGLAYLAAKKRLNNMATYALVEAASLMRTPVLREAAQRALEALSARQKSIVNANRGGVIPRYCAVMALVAAKLAHLSVAAGETTEGVFREAYLAMRNEKAEDWSRIRGEGVWHYMVAAVCLQYLGRGDDLLTHKMLQHLERVWRPATLGTSPIACCPVRSNYFATMMFFNAGEETWARWNAGMIEAYVKTQDVETGCSGKAIGSWRCSDKHIGDQPFWTTCYVALQLMAYYRYLPTYSQEAWSGVLGEGDTVDWVLPGWVEVEVVFDSP